MIKTNSSVLLTALCITVYWLTVIIKSALITKKIGKTPNIIPKEIQGLLSRLIMTPLIILWVFLPWQTVLGTPPLYTVMSWLGTFLCVIALTCSFYCWYYMGNAWRIGIDPKEKNLLLTDGPFKTIRHPIYSLSMLLMLGSFLSVQTQAMATLLIIHWLLFRYEAYREEQYLSKVHGHAYKQYMQQTNRFLPILRRVSDV